MMSQAPIVALRLQSRFPLWAVILAGCLIALLSYGPRSAMALFLAPMTDAKGWSREVFALAIAIQNLLWGLGQPLAGYIADRWGNGRVLAAGGLIYASGLAIMSWAPTPVWLNVGAGLCIGLGMATTSFTVVLAALGRRVPPEKASMVFGIGTASASLGQFLFAPLGAQLIASVGWADALLFLGALMLFVPILGFALAGQPDPVIAGSVALREQSLWQAVTEAFGHRSYVLLSAGFFICGTSPSLQRTCRPISPMSGLIRQSAAGRSHWSVSSTLLVRSDRAGSARPIPSPPCCR